MTRTLVAAFVVCFLVYTINAQNIEGVNARLDGMAGSGVADDIGWSVGNPRGIASFPDQIQGSAQLKNFYGKEKVFGKVIAVKSLGEHFLMGFTFNNSNVINSDFLSNMFSFYEYDFGDGQEINKIDLPHLNLCYKINDDFAVGLGFYSDLNRARESKMDTTTNENTMNLDTIDYTEEATYFGLKPTLDVKLTLGGLTIVPIIRLGMPKFDLNVVEKINDSVTVEKKADVSFFDAVDLTIGSQFWGEIGENFLIFGIWFENMGYQMEKSADNLSAEFNNRSIDWFIGIQPYFNDNLYIAPEYDGGVYTSRSDYSKKEPTDTTQRVTQEMYRYQYHHFRLGLEKTLDKVWFFDAIDFRAGFVYKLFIDNYEKNDANGGVYEESKIVKITSNAISSDATPTGVKVSAGIGLKKGRAAFDISADLLTWSTVGIVAGPMPAMATLTFDIARKKE